MPSSTDLPVLLLNQPINKVKGSAMDNEKEEFSSFPSLLALSLLTLPAFRPPRDDWGRAIVLLAVVENDVQ